MGIVKELYDILSRCATPNEFNELTACLARCRTSIAKCGVCLLCVDERGAKYLHCIRGSDGKLFRRDHLVGYPGTRVHHTIENYVAGALDVG